MPRPFRSFPSTPLAAFFRQTEYPMAVPQELSVNLLSAVL